MAEQSPVQKIVVPIVAGIGNAVMTVPLVRALGKLPDASVTVAARTGPMAEVFQGLAEVHAVERLGTGALEMRRRLREMSGTGGISVLVIPFPSNRWQYAVLAMLSGARHVVMHRYPSGRLRSLRWMAKLARGTSFLPAKRGIHDVVQNLDLLRALGVDAPSGEDSLRPTMQLTDADRDQSRKLHGGRGFVVIQPGCGDTVVGRAKRWPVDRYAELVDALVREGHEPVLIEGPDERGVAREVANRSAVGPRVIELNGPLKVAAALLERAAMYVGTDSGLAHVAAAVGTPPVTLFAAADPTRVAPWGFSDLVVTPPAVNGKAWAPRLLYPMDHPGPRLRDDGIDWASHIRVEDVLAAVKRAEGRRGGKDER